MTSLVPSSPVPYLPPIITTTSTKPPSSPSLLHLHEPTQSNSFLHPRRVRSFSNNPFLEKPKMASNSLKSISQRFSSIHNLQLFDPAITNFPSTLPLNPTTPHPSISSSTTNTSFSTFSISPTTSTTPSTSQQPAGPTSLDVLERHLSGQNFRQADEETRRLLIELAGDPARKRGYVFFSEVQFISKEGLVAIDELWKKYSNEKFGYSVQRRIWKQKAKRDFSKFFIKVGWMKKLDTEVEQYYYRAFPDEFVWELNEDTPEGHLPLTNALRGTQLLNCVLSHPAFDKEGEEEEDEEAAAADKVNEAAAASVKGATSKPLNKRVFKTDYGF